jgi:hypothetical protein
VWSGRDAEERRLIDRAGGLPTALDEVRQRIGSRASGLTLPPRTVWPHGGDLPPQDSDRRRALLQTLGLSVLAPVHDEVEALLGLVALGEHALAWADVPKIE